MFKSLLLISCLVFVVGCGEDSETEPTVAEPKLWVGDATGDDLDMLASERYTAITGNLVIKNSQIDAIDLPHLQSVDGNVFIGSNPILTTISMSTQLKLQGINGRPTVATSPTVDGWI